MFVLLLQGIDKAKENVDQGDKTGNEVNDHTTIMAGI